MWIVHVVGHADGETFVGPFPDSAQAVAWGLLVIDTLPEFAGYTTLRALPISPSYTV